MWPSKNYHGMRYWYKSSLHILVLDKPEEINKKVLLPLVPSVVIQREDQSFKELGVRLRNCKHHPSISIFILH